MGVLTTSSWFSWIGRTELCVLLSCLLRGYRLPISTVGDPQLDVHKDGSAKLHVHANRLPNDPARLSATGVRMMASYPDDRETETPTQLPADCNDASRAPIRPGDMDRMIERCLPGDYSFDSFAVAELGKVHG